MERGGLIRTEVSPDATAHTIGSFLRQNVEQGTRLLTDKSNRYNKVAVGYDRHSVNHKNREFVRGDVHVNHVESFWPHIKRSIKGTHKVISAKYLSAYLDGFVFHYNNRGNDNLRFSALMGVLLHVSR